jgi:hypothetical protein
MSDRYVSLLLGLPCGTGDDCFRPEETLNGADGEIDLQSSKSSGSATLN